MLRVLFQGIAAGLRRMWSFASAFVFWPFLFFSRPSRGVSARIDMDTVAAVEKAASAPGMKPSELIQSQERDVRLAHIWILTSLLTRSTRPFPPALSKTMKAWLQGLNYAELTALRNAGNKGIFEHSYGKTRVAGVPRMQLLAPVSVKYPVEIRKAADEIALSNSAGLTTGQLGGLALAQGRQELDVLGHGVDRFALPADDRNHFVVRHKHVRHALIDPIGSVGFAAFGDDVGDVVAGRNDSDADRRAQTGNRSDRESRRNEMITVHI